MSEKDIERVVELREKLNGLLGFNCLKSDSNEIIAAALKSVREEEAEAWKMGNRSIRTAIQEARNEALEEAENVARYSSKPSDYRHEHVTCTRVAEAIAKLRGKK